MGETAINRVNDVSPGDGVFGQIGVVHVHGANGTEEPHYAPVLYRNGTTHYQGRGPCRQYVHQREGLNYW
jgi:hypothetical protein